ncbi:unnamed protein product [Ilex paraguariensis]|uniref:Uncharacterized protein n=1 Tax=Ilex paraguariensis TaxID=185542 RepID=A0ABC8T4Q1_9AQUA
MFPAPFAATAGFFSHSLLQSLLVFHGSAQRVFSWTSSWFQRVSSWYFSWFLMPSLRFAAGTYGLNWLCFLFFPAVVPAWVCWLHLPGPISMALALCWMFFVLSAKVFLFIFLRLYCGLPSWFWFSAGILFFCAYSWVFKVSATLVSFGAYQLIHFGLSGTHCSGSSFLLRCTSFNCGMNVVFIGCSVGPLRLWPLLLFLCLLF